MADSAITRVRMILFMKPPFNVVSARLAGSAPSIDARGGQAIHANVDVRTKYRTLPRLHVADAEPLFSRERARHQLLKVVHRSLPIRRKPGANSRCVPLLLQPVHAAYQ